ncbi:MAG: FAD-binding oxidoreductase [Actinomycetota bacterium]|nr:FAD-binding oxidoreductase [Actinomycetota bacterium]
MTRLNRGAEGGITDVLDETASSLAGRIDGQLLVPGDSGYDEARAVWNAMVDRRPSYIVRCANAADVRTAVRFARDRRLEIGVRCGGHGVLGPAVPEDGLMIDLAAMNLVRVDPELRRASVQGGALLGALDLAAQQHGLATTAGNVSHTGVGGLTLGGGMGWLARQFGLTCDNVTAFELVTADGAVLRATASQNSDLFWGLRGGGGNFGVVTQFEFRLHPVAPQALVVNFFFPIDVAPAVLQRWRDLIGESPRQATFTAGVGDAPTSMPAELRGRPLARVGFVWLGDPDRCRSLLGALRGLGRPVAESIEEASYLDLQRMDDDAETHHLRRYWKGHYFRELSDDAIESFLLRGTPDGHGDMLPAASLQAYGGAIAEVPDGDSAFSHRDTLVEFVTAARWTDPMQDEQRMSAARRYAASLDGYAAGAYVNVLTDEGQEGVRRAYPPAKLARLTALKDVYDPENVFHLNHNIRPSGAAN